MNNILTIELADNAGSILFGTSYFNAETAFEQFYKTLQMKNIDISNVKFTKAILRSKEGKYIHECDLTPKHQND